MQQHLSRTGSTTDHGPTPKETIMNTRNLCTHIIAVLFLTIGVVNAATTTFTGTGGTYNNDTWNQLSGGLPQYWNNGIPSGAGPWDVVISSGSKVYVTSTYLGAGESPTPAYTGNLTLQANVYMEFGMHCTDDDFNALGTGTITMNSGSGIFFRRRANSVHDQNIVLAGDAQIDPCLSTDAHVKSRTFNGTISGSGKLTTRGTSSNTMIFTNDNPLWSGGLRAYNGASMVTGAGTGSFGTGDLWIEDSMSLKIAAADAIDDSATLYLIGTKGTDAGKSTTKLVMNANDTIGELIVGSPTDSQTLISGSGTLTVSGPATFNGTAATTWLGQDFSFTGLTFEGTGSWSIPNDTITVNGGTITTTADASIGTLNSNGFTKEGNGTLTLVDATGVSGSVNIAGGTLDMNDSLNVTNMTVTNLGNTLDVAPGENVTVSGTISGTGSLSKTGAGTMTVTGDTSGLANAIDVIGGTLEVGGTGTLGLGTGIDTMNIGGNTLTLTDGATIEWQFADTEGLHDRISGTTLDLTGLTNIIIHVEALAGATASKDDEFELFNGTVTPTGLAFNPDIFTFTGYNAGFWTMKEGSLTIVSTIPEPSTAILAGLGLMGVCFRRRRK